MPRYDYGIKEILHLPTDAKNILNLKKKNLMFLYQPQSFCFKY